MSQLIDQLCDRVDALIRDAQGRRVIVGIVGAPGSGKSTLADALVRALLDRPADWAVPPSGDQHRPWIGSHVAHVPMDGFHLADVELRRLGRADRKGAPDTFDAAGYANLLDRVKRGDEDVWAPAFDRDIEQPVAGSVPILRATRIVVTEGNYLLLDEPVWRRARTLMDTVWFCDLQHHVRIDRLIARHVRFGKTAQASATWANGPDQRNAERVMATRSSANLIVSDG